MRRQVRVRLFGDPTPVAVQCDHTGLGPGQNALEPLLRQQHPGRGISQHVGQPVLRIGRVQRHIGAAGLQDAQQTHHHLQAALGADRDQNIGAHARTAQVVRQAVGPGVEFGIAQRLILEHHRRSIGRIPHLRLEQFMDTVILRVVGLGGVPVVKHLAALGLRQHADPAHGGIRCVFQGSDQVFQRRVHHRAQPFRRHWRQGLRGQREAFAQVVHIQHDRVVGALSARQGFDALPGGGTVRRGVDLAVPVVEQCAEQRRRRLHAAAALRQAQRRMFMAQQAGQPVLHVTDLFQDTALVQPHSQRQGVDEHPQHPPGALAALHAPEQHCAEHHVIAPGGPRQYRGPGQMEQTCGADAQGPGLFPQPARQVRGDGQLGFLNTAAVAQYVEQTERCRRLVDIGQHAAEKGFVLFRFHPQSGLRDEIAERQRRRQLLCLIQLVHLDLFQQDGQRGVIERQMVRQ